LLNNIAVIGAAALEALWTDSEPMPVDDDPVWLEMWIRRDDARCESRFDAEQSRLGFELKEPRLKLPDHVVVIAKAVREILGLVLEQVRSSAEKEMNDDADYGEADNDEDTQDEKLTIEERPWSAGEIAEQIQILSDAAGVDWREELSWTIQSLEEAEDEHAKQIR
jgi:hypothetical protein